MGNLLFSLSLSKRISFLLTVELTWLVVCLSVRLSICLSGCLSVCLSASSFVGSLVFLSNSISISCLFRCFQEDTKNEVKNRYVLNSFYMYVLGPELGLQVGACCLTAPTDRDMIYVQYARWWSFSLSHLFPFMLSSTLPPADLLLRTRAAVSCCCVVSCSSLFCQSFFRSPNRMESKRFRHFEAKLFIICLHFKYTS